jgi:hypothetical protein
MVTQEIIANINRIDGDLKNLFENVYIYERTKGNQFYFEIKANAEFYNESKDDLKRIEIKALISKVDILNENIKWYYSANPLDESSNWVERTSNINYIAQDMYDVIVKGRMDENYFNSLESIVELINESNVTDVEKEIFNKIKDIASNHGVSIESIEKDDIFKDNFMEQKPDSVFRFYHNSDIKVSEMFKIETEIKSNEGVNWVLFKQGFIEVNYSNI